MPEHRTDDVDALLREFKRRGTFDGERRRLLSTFQRGHLHSVLAASAKALFEDEFAHHSQQSQVPMKVGIGPLSQANLMALAENKLLGRIQAEVISAYFNSEFLKSRMRESVKNVLERMRRGDPSSGEEVDGIENLDSAGRSSLDRFLEECGALRLFQYKRRTRGVINYNGKVEVSNDGGTTDSRKGTEFGIDGASIPASVGNRDELGPDTKIVGGAIGTTTKGEADITTEAGPLNDKDGSDVTSGIGTVTGVTARTLSGHEETLPSIEFQRQHVSDGSQRPTEDDSPTDLEQSPKKKRSRSTKDSSGREAKRKKAVGGRTKKSSKKSSGASKTKSSAAPNTSTALNEHGANQSGDTKSREYRAANEDSDDMMNVDVDSVGANDDE